MQRLITIIIVSLLSFPLHPWARGGGGCLEKGTMISTLHGLMPIEAIQVGDLVWSNVNGKFQQSKVVAKTQVQPKSYLKVVIADHILKVTKDHLIAIDKNIFRRAIDLKPGDKIVSSKNLHWNSLTILSIHKIKEDQPAYNILVDHGATYFANGLLVHNKGCFLPETPILLSDGTSTPISQIKKGDSVKAYDIDGKILNTTVNNIITHDVDEYYTVSTNQVTLHVTAEHPFYIGKGTFKTVSALSIGDKVYVLHDGILKSQVINTIEKISKHSVVYNLQTNEPHTYFASGVAVHNKGGGGGGGFHGGRGSSRSSPPCNPKDTSCKITNFVTGLFGWVFVIIYVIFRVFIRKDDEDLDFIYSDSQINKKAIKTNKLLEFLARQDVTMRPQALKEVCRSTFLKLQECWQARNYDPMQSLLMPDLYDEQLNQIAGLIRNHEINKIDDLKIIKIDLVNVRYTDKKEQREFTALITASATDYYVNDSTNKFIRGDVQTAKFQEFWTFQLQPTGWSLREIEQSRESNFLKEENFFEQYTDAQLQKIYEGAVDKLGPAGPWLEKEVQSKSTNTQRMLNFLAQSDKLWDSQLMVKTARKIFTDVHMALEAGEMNVELSAELFPNIAEEFTMRINLWKSTNQSIEYRNFCIRKVELLLIRNFDDKSKKEYTARIRAHAQRIHLKNNIILSKDPDVVSFEEYWTFGRLDNQWKLKEALPAYSKDKAVATENIDEGSSPDLVKWYYTKKRAI